jgi:hypothetical protein
MMAAGYPQVVSTRRSFLSTVAWGVSTAVIAVILAAAAIILYGMNIADRKTDTLAGLAEAGIRNLPELRRALPPVLADAINDERKPDYRDQLDITARLATVPGCAEGRHGEFREREALRPVVEVRNRGKEVVSLLSLRIVVLNEDNVPVAESNEWAATPIAADRDWCGPLMPGATAYIVAQHTPIPEAESARKLHVEVTVTDIRVWNKNAPPPAAAEAPRPPEAPRVPARAEAPRPPEAPRAPAPRMR